MILFYTTEKNRITEMTEQAIIDQMPDRHLVYCNSLAVVEQRLRRPCNDIEAIVFNVNDANEMRHLNEIRNMLLYFRVVFILPSRNKDIIDWAHKLAPRFIAYADDSSRQVGAVIGKMLGAGKLLWSPTIRDGGLDPSGAVPRSLSI
jgi:hypothetical protein